MDLTMWLALGIGKHMRIKWCKKTYMKTIISKDLEKGSLFLQYGEPQDWDEIYDFTLSMGVWNFYKSFPGVQNLSHFNRMSQDYVIITKYTQWKSQVEFNFALLWIQGP